MTLISVLPRPEIKEFDEPPIFNSVERKRFFDLTDSLQKALVTLRTPANKVLFFVSYAYFRARKRFFDELRKKDLMYASNALMIDYETIKSECSYDYKIKLDHQKKILSLAGFAHFNEYDIEDLNAKVYLDVKSYKNPRVIFANMVDYLLLNKIALPKYRQFVNVISEQIQKYKIEVNQCLKEHLDDNIRFKLDSLLSDDYDKYATLHFFKALQPIFTPW